MQKNKCSNCNLINFQTDNVCKRCHNNLYSEANLSDTSVKDSLLQSDELRKVPLGMKTLFTFIYILAIALSFVLIGGSLALITKISENITLVIIAVVVGLLAPLVAANLFIENWKRKITGEVERSPDFENQAINSIENEIEKLPPVLTVIQAGLCLGVGLLTAVISGQVLRAILPNGNYPLIILGLPAIIAGIATIFIFQSIVSYIIKR